MAVKKHELVHDNRSQLDLKALVEYIQLMNEQPAYNSAPSELIKNCQDVVKCLARASGNGEQLWSFLPPIEDFLIRAVHAADDTFRHEIVTAILDKFYSFISDPKSGVCPAASVVLVVLDTTNTEATLSAARWLVQQGDDGPESAGLRTSLSCLYSWLYDWHGTPALGNFVLAFIHALEENNRHDILIEVSVDNLGRLFLALYDPIALREPVADVIFHVLASLRESTEAFDRISPHVDRVLTNLASDSGQWSRQLLQNVVDILSATVDVLLSNLKGEAQDMFRDKYSDVFQCLERHMASHGCRYLQMSPWRTRSTSTTSVSKPPPMRKVGLLNLGNTCYMNSVMQALLVTRQFSTHVVLRMTSKAYWSRMGVLFGKMMYSAATKVNPSDFFDVVKPPFFTQNNQHDSSEFLGYLFELLQSYEQHPDLNFDYSRPAVLASHSRGRLVSQQASPQTTQSSDAENVEPGPNRRSVSPRPGSSAGGSSSTGQKRPSSERDGVPAKRRMRVLESGFLRRDSYIDNMFAGVLLTRVECNVCHSSSLSRDVFRDLQLAFPDKPQGGQYSVQNLLEFYCSKEILTGENRYLCRDCGVLRDAERSVRIESTPKYLILVLKNFKFEPKLQVQTKLMQPTYHNPNITLPTVRARSGPASYNLYAAVIHAGTTLDSGHYYTLAKDNDRWHMYNDDNVSAADETQLHRLNRSSTPYILFYKRSDIEEGTAPSMEQLPTKVQQSVVVHNKYYVENVRKTRMTRP